MNYRELKEKENRAKLFGVIKNKVNFLSEEEIKKVVDLVDPNLKYRIVVLKHGELDIMSKYLTFIKYSGFRHSWAGEEYTRTEKLEVILNKEAVHELGYLYDYQYYNNGNLEVDDMEQTTPDFDVTKNIVVQVIEKHYSDYNNNYYNHQENILVFYKGAILL